MGSGGRSCLRGSPKLRRCRCTSSDKVNNFKTISIADGCAAPTAARENGPILFDSNAIAFEFEMQEQVGDNGASVERKLASLPVEDDLEWHTVEAIRAMSCMSSLASYRLTRMRRVGAVTWAVWTGLCGCR